jgi:hypothetical protein
MRSYLGWRLLREVREKGHYLRPPLAIAAHLRVFSHAVFFWSQGVWYAEMLAICRTLSVT